MAFNIPQNVQQVRDRVATDAQNELPTSNPFFKNSFLGALITSISGSNFELYLQLNELIKQSFVDTATDEFLERWGVYRNITRNPATKSSGSVVVSGSLGSAIPLNSQLSTSEGLIFTTQASQSINAYSISIASLERSGSTVTAITSSDHSLATGLSVTISGANEVDYNVTADITVISSNSFSYQVTTTPATPATGTPIASANIATLSVQSEGFGGEYNVTSGSSLSFNSAIVGIDQATYVTFSGISGGSDSETDENLQIRIIDAYQNPIAQFNKNQIISRAKRVTGVTRVFVFESGDLYGDNISIDSINRDGQVATVVTNTPHGLEDCMTVAITGFNELEYNIQTRVLVIDDTTFSYIISGTPATPATGTGFMQASIPLGQVVVFFTRDNDSSNIPDANEVQAVKDELLKIKPVNTGNSDLIVKAPQPQTVNFEFTSIVPDTSSMRTAITENLKVLFEENTSVGKNLNQFEYQSVIFRTIDTETGQQVTNYALSTPSGDIAVNANSIPVIGNVTFI